MTDDQALLDERIRRACLWEATARKVGNVHPEASFADLTWRDFVDAGEAAAPVLARTRELGVGRAVLEAIKLTRARTGTNVNLGIVLLIAPLAAVPPKESLESGIENVLNGLTVQDSIAVYEAIRLARPGGLGTVEAEDVAGVPTGTLREVMALAADRDLIARQYVSNFELVFDSGRRLRQRVPDAWSPGTETAAESLPRVETAILRLQLEILAKHPDSLIVRKCGPEVGTEASRRAAAVLDVWERPDAERQVREFDDWLRADANRRNPGTTADLIAAALFVALAEGSER